MIFQEDFKSEHQYKMKDNISEVKTSILTKFPAIELIEAEWCIYASVI